MKRFLPLLLAVLLLLPAAAFAEGYGCPYYEAHGDHEWIQSDFSYPTCTENGYVYLECATCGAQDTLVTPAYGHSWYKTGDGQASTCIEKGWTMEECSECGQVRTYELPLKDHSFGSWQVVLPATDHSAGTRARTCSVCGSQETHYYYMDGTLYRGGPSGADVAGLQQMLIDLHYLNDRADGSFGKKTEQAVRDYQQAAGLEVSGVAYPQTLAALAADWERALNSAAEPQPPSGDAGADRPPFCLRSEADGEVHIDFCAAHYPLYAAESALRAGDLADPDALARLEEIDAEWKLAVEVLYSQWAALLPAEQQSLAAEAHEAFLNWLSLQQAALASLYGDDAAALLTAELDILHEQCTTLCGFINLISE